MSLGVVDYRRALECVAGVGETEGFDDYCARVLPGLRQLVPADIAFYDEVDVGARRALVLSWPDGVPTPAGHEAWRLYMHEHPVLIHILETGDRHALAISDFLRARDLHRLGLWTELYRPLEIEDQLGVALAKKDGTMIGVSLNRNRRSFTARERELLTLVAPHLARSRDAAIRRDALRRLRAQLEDALEATGRAVVVVDGHAGVAHATRAALRVLRARGWRRGRLPEDVLRLREGDLIVLDAAAPTRAQMTAAGLTEAESDVLARVAGFATNAEIADELCISTRTVEKHLEHIYDKLGVRGRRLAVRAVKGL